MALSVDEWIGNVCRYYLFKATIFIVAFLNLGSYIFFYLKYRFFVFFTVYNINKLLKLVCF